MSDVPNDPTQGPAAGGGDDQPSEEEVRAYLEQLRAAPVEQVVAEVASALLNAAQVKLGRPDGRLLLDLVAGIADGGRGQLPDEITDQLDEALRQLRLAQVEAEGELGGAGAQEPGTQTAETPTPGSGTTRGAATGADASERRASSRLWVPGS